MRQAAPLYCWNDSGSPVMAFMVRSWKVDMRRSPGETGDNYFTGERRGPQHSGFEQCWPWV